MKKIIFVVLFFLMVANSFAQTLVVAPIESTGNAVSAEDALVIGELFNAELASIGDVVVSNPFNLEQALLEMDFQEQDWADSSKTSELGKAAKADIIVRGKVLSLGNKNYMSATMLDVKTALTLSSVQIQFSNIDTIFTILDDLSIELTKPLTGRMEIGDTGPGGGLIYFIDEDTYYECSEFLGQATWSEARALAKNYRGGNFSDWYLPNKKELDLVYQNLRKNSHIKDNGWFWSSSGSSNHASIQSFGDGIQHSSIMLNTLGVRAIRKFTVDSK